MKVSIKNAYVCMQRRSVRVKDIFTCNKYSNFSPVEFDISCLSVKQETTG